MNQSCLLLAALLCTLLVSAQNSLKIKVINADTKEPLPAATVSIPALGKTMTGDSSGIVAFENLPGGKYKLLLSHVGFEEKVIPVSIPFADTFLLVELEQGHHEEEEVVIQSTRTSRTISNIPTRVESISGEELDEKANMKPGDIRMLLNETTGIQTQQTSATSYNSSIRIQGLDGRYTQILRDGYPLYAGFSGGLSIMQIAPLDLKQVEVIKGSSSTLYGGGAIAGLVNLISKKPEEEPELSLMSNFTSAGGVDLSGFYSQKFNKTGISFFATRNTTTAYDPANIGLTAIPESERYTLHPRLFFYFNEKATLDLGVSTVWENRTGGSTAYIKDGSPGYFEKNKTNRFTAHVGFENKIRDKARFNFKNSVSLFHRRMEIPGYVFEGDQTSTFTEAAYDMNVENFEWIFGVNLLTDQFTEEESAGIIPRDYSQTTFGSFIQNTWKATDAISVESGLRGDYVIDYGFSLLPRISVLFKLHSKLSSRIGGGLGYKAPTVFTEDAERIQFRDVLPVNIAATNIERSAGVNFDINLRTKILDGAVDFSMNHLFFYTRINQPLVLSPAPGGQQEFINANGHYDTRGIESNLKFIYHDFKLFVGYTYADVNSHFDDIKSWLPLTARHRLNNVLMYEVEEKWKLGLEAYYFSPQKLNDGSRGRSYWICGFFAEKLWEKFSLFINFENFTDTRQSKFDNIFTGTVTNPVFRDIYAPVDGFVVNGGVKLRL